MRWSRAFLPVLKESPADAQIVSHKLMLRAGLVRQTAAGIYAWLPLGFRVLKKIEQIVREEQDRAGAQEMLMPTLQSAELWRESGRYDAYGPEMLRIKDRHEREMLYGPTNEEMLTAIVRDDMKSYRDLPRTLYHIQWKFRDEVRPRFGVMRGREFLMKDAYSFDLDEAGARNSYYTQMLAYLRTFQRMGIQAVPMKAASGPIGGDLSATSSSCLPRPARARCSTTPPIDEFDWQQSDLRYDDEAGLQALFDRVNSTYAATDETHDEARWELGRRGQAPDRPRDRGRAHLLFRRQIFGGDGAQGLGPGRVDGDPDDGQLRRRRVAPGRGDHRGEPRRGRDRLARGGRAVAGRPGHHARRRRSRPSTAADRIYAELNAAGVETLYDDRDERGGVKLGSMDLIGLPWQLIVGPRGIASGMVELKRRSTGEREELSIESALARLTA